ncbi:hypothetical protein BC937DRAFT_92103 [Endogone sp. FLAS-F59071]|nr:hypothetical protein BC937DRAFT_92103 [Endogone sp. FLAS-F59071]|eukprot:RUS15711.1 hypothetical protein BC937DRAFT_92103 [Endogone sp. FLAS-F59071]
MEITHLDPNHQIMFKSTPQQKWWDCFMNRHPELSFQVPQALTEVRAQRTNPIIIRDHFQKLSDLIIKYKLNAIKIWNMDKTSFNIESQLEKIIAKKDKMILKGILEGAPARTVCTFTETRYIYKNIFQQYIQHFIKLIPPTCPVMLMLDGAGSYIELISIDLCLKNNILLYILLSNTIYILQAAEIPFKKLKSEYSKVSNAYCNNGEGDLVTKFIFAKVLDEVFLFTYTLLAIINTFKATGVWPLNSKVITEDRMASLITQIPAINIKKILQHNIHGMELIYLQHLVQQLQEENT